MMHKNMLVNFIFKHLVNFSRCAITDELKCIKKNIFLQNGNLQYLFRVSFIKLCHHNSVWMDGLSNHTVVLVSCFFKYCSWIFSNKY